MALDFEHHLEGTLEPPGTFRLYLYDSRTRPLPPARVKQARGTLYWGEYPDPPGLPLVVAGDGGTLEAVLDRPVEFPAQFTLLIHLPGSDPADKPELFNFGFNQFSGE